MKRLVFTGLFFSLLLLALGEAESACTVVVGSAPPKQSCAFTASWVDNSNNEDGFRLERKTTRTGVYANVATPAMNAVSHIDTVNDDPGATEYCYRLRAFNAAGQSAWTTPDVCITSAVILLAPAVPQNFTVTQAP